MEFQRFVGTRVLVTGSSRNTGYGIAERFAAEGAIVVVNGTDPARVAEAAQRLRRKATGRIVEAPADLSTVEGVDALFAVVAEECGGLDVLVNNAVHLGIGPTFTEVSDDLLQAVIGVNLFGYFRCGQRAARMMIADGRGRGAIVNLSSNTADQAIRCRSAYVASKGAIDALTRAMAVDLAPHGIRVNTVAPGYIATDRWQTIDDETAARRRSNVPLGEPASFNDVAAAVLYLASDAAGNITGARLVVDGGVSAQLLPGDVGG
jgi:NAD(P)-dependent dehydrogenase (short-subunit alcohol dehydrogenase family)